MKRILSLALSTIILIFSANAQVQEVLSPLKYNPVLYQQYGQYQHSIDPSARTAYFVDDALIFKADTMSLPFIEDFSGPNTLKPYDLSAFSTDTFLASGGCLDEERIESSTQRYLATDQRWTYTFNDVTGNVDSIAITNPDEVDIRNYEPVGAGDECFFSFTDYTVWEVFERPDIVTDTGIVTWKPVSGDNFPDTLIDVREIYFVDYQDTTLKWMDNEAFVNDCYAILPPSLGVATLDGLNEFGLPHDNTPSSAYGVADKLTSKPLDLSGFNELDNVFISFFYQAQGLGDYPNTEDSLILEFRDSEGRWNTIWSSIGYPDAASVPVDFSQVMIQVEDQDLSTDPFYFYKGFQFRFKNKASLGGNNDHWHIDYIRMNDNRLNDTILRDIALSYPVTSILKNYELVPWKQYSAGTDELRDSIGMVTINSGPNTPSTGWETSAMQIGGATINSVPTSFFTADNTSPVVRHILPSTNYNMGLVSGGNKVRIETEFVITPSADNLLLTNDTSRAVQYFHNILAYDDGCAERAYGLEGVGIKKFAYEFNIEAQDTIRGFQVHFTQIDEDVSNLVFNFQLWDSIDRFAPFLPKDSLIASLDNRKPIYVDSINGFATFLFDSGIVVPAGSYYLGWSQTDTRNLQIGYDLNSKKGFDHIWVQTSGKWRKSTLDLKGSPMMRLILDGNYPGIATDVKQPLAQVPATKPLLYPNPVSDRLYIELDGGYKTGYTYAIFDQTGRRLIFNNYMGESLDVSQLPSGFYLLQLQNEEGIALPAVKFVKY